jgi:hypothetical protein
MALDGASVRGRRSPHKCAVHNALAEGSPSTPRKLLSPMFLNESFLARLTLFESQSFLIAEEY